MLIAISPSSLTQDNFLDPGQADLKALQTVSWLILKKLEISQTFMTYLMYMLLCLPIVTFIRLTFPSHKL